MKQYYACIPGKEPQGPFPEALVRDAQAQGLYPPGTMVRETTNEHWVSVEEEFPASLSHDKKEQFGCFVRGLVGFGLLSLGKIIGGLIVKVPPVGVILLGLVIVISILLYKNRDKMSPKWRNFWRGW